MARKQRVKVRVKQKKSLWQIIKTIIVILLILGILASMKSCSDPKIKINLPGGKLGELFEKIANIFPGGFLGFEKPSDIPDPNKPGDTPGDIPGGDSGTSEHNCNADYLYYEAVVPTCVSEGSIPYSECTKCHRYFDESGNEITLEEAAIPINPDLHRYGDFISNGNGTHYRECDFDNSHPVKMENCSYSEDWRWDSIEHFNRCFCGDTINNEPHIDDDDDEICDVCNADLFGDGGEGGGDNPEGEEPDNPNLPDGPGCEHIDEDNDGICDGCGGIFGDNSGDSCEHVDNNNDGICDNCDADIKDDSGEPDEPFGPGDSDCIHEWSEWKIISVANCTQGGQQIRTCTKEGCGYTEYAYYSYPLGHEPDEHNICVRCGIVLDGHLHTYSNDDWVIDIEPTCYSYGERHVDCETCGDVIVEKIGTTSHTFDADNYCTVCGYHLPSDDFDDVNVNDSTVGNTSIELNGGTFDVLEHKIDMPHVNNGGMTEGNVIVYLGQHPAPSPIRIDLNLDSEEFSSVIIIRARFSRPIESGNSLVIRLSDGTEYSPIGDIYGQYEAIFMVELDKNNSYGNQFSLEFDYSSEKGYIEVQELYVDYIYNYSIEGET